MTTTSAVHPPPQLFRPVIRAEPFLSGLPTGLRRADRDHLAAIATPFHVAKDVVICRRGAPAEAIFNITSGTARSYRAGPHGRRILAFLFAGDLCGLARNGTYVNTVDAVTGVTALRIPLEPLTAMLRRDADLQFLFLCKVVQAVREMQHQAIVTTRRDPVDRVAAFLSMIEEAQSDNGQPETIDVPMRAQDIGEYVDLTAEQVRRGLDELRREGAIERTAAGPIRIVNRRRFNRRLSGV